MLNPMQEKLLEMLKWLTAYLDNNSITYYILGGTLLGAIRHKGFIPWDDDIDIGLPRPDYEKFLEVFQETEQYKLETPFDKSKDFIYTYSKFYNKQTTLIERQRHNVKRGIYIDVFPLDGLGKTFDESISFFKQIDRKNMFLMTRTCAIRKQRKITKNIAIIIGRMIPEFLFSPKKFSIKIARLCKKNDYNSSLFVGNLNGAYREREIISKDVFGTPTEYQFENIIVKGPRNYDAYLSQIYHDWKKLPPVEKRGVQHDYIYCDLNASYLKKIDN